MMASDIATFENEIKEYKLQVSRGPPTLHSISDISIVGDSPTRTPSRSG
jgi:hypothetical protein